MMSPNRRGPNIVFTYHTIEDKRSWLFAFKGAMIGSPKRRFPRIPPENITKTIDKVRWRKNI